MDDTIFFAFTVYFIYYLLSRAAILNRPRGWVFKTLPKWLTYPLHCPFCFTFWASVLVTLLVHHLANVWSFRLDFYFVAPVINYLIGLVASSLQKYLESGDRPAYYIASTPPLLNRSDD